MAECNSEQSSNTDLEQKFDSSKSSCTDITLGTSEILTHHILEHYKDIQVLEAKLKEILDIQQECINGLAKENTRFKDINKCFNFKAMFSQISNYTKKLNYLRSDMIMIQDRVARLKHRSTAVKDYQEKKMNAIRDAKLLQEERERLITAKPVWEVDATKTQEKT